MRDKNRRCHGTCQQRAVIPLQLPAERENVAIRSLAREELQARFHGFALGGVWSGPHSGIHQIVVDVDVGSHGNKREVQYVYVM